MEPSRFDLDLHILPLLLKHVPELRHGFEAMKEEYASLTEADLYDVRQVEKQHGLSPLSLHSPGSYQVFELLLTEYIVFLAKEQDTRKRLQEVMAWIEELANSSLFPVRNLLALTVCEALLTTHQAQVKSIYPYMGSQTRALCLQQFDSFHISPEIQELFRQ